ncbi:MAG: SLC13 family permease [Nitrososphaerota archaeon]
MKKIITYVVSVILIFLAVNYVGLFTGGQVISLTVFLGIIASILFFWRFRVAFALIGTFVLLSSGLTDIPHLVEFAGLDIILFLIGMMTVVGFMEERHFFEYLLGRVTKLGSSSIRLLVVLMGMSALSAALVDEVTSILFMSSLVIHLTRRLDMPTVPLLILVVFATNIGSSATVVGNPIGVMIALRAGLSFAEFIRWATPISIITLFMSIGLGYLYYRRYFSEMDNKLKGYAQAVAPALADNGVREKLDKSALLLFIFTISLLVAHTTIENALGLEKNTILVAAPLLGAAIALFLQGSHARELFEKRVDWWTLAFFLLFFSTVGTLKYVGTIGVFAQQLSTFIADKEAIALPIIGYVSGFMSAFMDNILAVAIWIPIIQEMGVLGLNTYPYWWTLLFAGTLMGNLMTIGSTANIVAIGLLERQKLGHITVREWLPVGALVSIPTFTLALLLLYVQLPLMT